MGGVRAGDWVLRTGGGGQWPESWAGGALVKALTLE